MHASAVKRDLYTMVLCGMMLFIDAPAFTMHGAFASLHLVYLAQRPWIAPPLRVCIVARVFVPNNSTEQEKEHTYVWVFLQQSDAYRKSSYNHEALGLRSSFDPMLDTESIDD